MKGNLDNYKVEDIKDFFDLKVRNDIKDIQKILIKEKDDKNKKFFEDILFFCMKIIKIELLESTDKKRLDELMGDYESAISLAKKKDYSFDDLKTSLNVVKMVHREFSKFASI